VILERQYRHAAGQFLIELPAGTREPGEAPLAAAKREMIEETGYRAKKWTMLLRYFASPGFLGEWMQIYLARDIREGEATWRSTRISRSAHASVGGDEDGRGRKDSRRQNADRTVAV
jgi:8-oxo-dGTP pyrophosphatase MutT (NUDIX family)